MTGGMVFFCFFFFFLARVLRFRIMFLPRSVFEIANTPRVQPLEMDFKSSQNTRRRSHSLIIGKSDSRGPIAPHKSYIGGPIASFRSTSRDSPLVEDRDHPAGALRATGFGGSINSRVRRGGKPPPSRMHTRERAWGSPKRMRGRTPLLPSSRNTMITVGKREDDVHMELLSEKISSFTSKSRVRRIKSRVSQSSTYKKVAFTAGAEALRDIGLPIPPFRLDAAAIESRQT
jgi:hypothetical protein